VDLLKEFTTLFVISSIDDILFYIAGRGYFGEELFTNTNASKDVVIENDRTKVRSCYALRTASLLLLFGAILGGWTWVVGCHRAKQWKLCFAEISKLHC